MRSPDKIAYEGRVRMTSTCAHPCGGRRLTFASRAQAPRVTDTIACTGGEQTWTVPAGVSQATFVVEGASGGVQGRTPPGLGAGGGGGGHGGLHEPFGQPGATA